MWTRDNLDVLRGVNSESIDLVYADPPFNSNKNYKAPIGSKAAGTAFKDTWTLSDIGGDRKGGRPLNQDGYTEATSRMCWSTWRPAQSCAYDSSCCTGAECGRRRWVG